MKWLIRLIINSTCRKNLWFEWKTDMRLLSITVVHSWFYVLSIASKSESFYFRSYKCLTKSETKHMLRVLFDTLRVLVELAHSKIYVTFTIIETIVPSATIKQRWIVCQEFDVTISFVNENYKKITFNAHLLRIIEIQNHYQLSSSIR